MNFLIIQTAFIGDVILATPVVEKLRRFYPDAKIDVLIRKGNEGLLKNHPLINELLIWNKKEQKIKNLLKIISTVRDRNYDTVINLHRFASSGFITMFSGARSKLGFNKNPLSFFYSKTIKHDLGSDMHEIERNLLLVEDLTDKNIVRPALYPSADDYKKAAQYSVEKYLCIAPTSVWFTKQFPLNKWVEFLNKIPAVYRVYLLGASSDKEHCDQIIAQSVNPSIINLAGQLSFLESAALMKYAVMNYVNDSAPMHMASAMNAPVTAIFCSTVPAFGFGPLSDSSRIVETKTVLSCRPCGLHGYRECPQGHFNCAKTIDIHDILN